MITFIIPIVGAMSPLWDYVLNDIIILMFIATVPMIIREVVKWNV